MGLSFRGLTQGLRKTHSLFLLSVASYAVTVIHEDKDDYGLLNEINT
jgi:hypothetical protein